MLFGLYPPRRTDDTSGTDQRRWGAVLVLLGLIGVAGCGGGGGNGNGGEPSPSRPAMLVLGTPTTVSGSAAGGLTFTFSETLTTISGSPAVTFALHEVNNGSVPVTVSAASDPITHDLSPAMAVQALDPQEHPVNLPPIAGSQTLTLNPGDTADTSQTFNLAYFPLPGRYTATVSATETQGVTALTTPLVLSAN